MEYELLKIRMVEEEILKKLGIRKIHPNSGACYGRWQMCTGEDLISINPATGDPIAIVKEAREGEYDLIVHRAHNDFKKWRVMPAPRRGEIVREICEEIRTHKKELGTLISLETGKILAEGEGEVQEAIDIGDFAVGLSRQLYGKSMHSERPYHRLLEQWHPLGPVGVITAFNFPMAVWSWNAFIAAVCGNTIIWKPSRETPLCAIALQNICNRVMERHRLRGIFNLLIGTDEEIGERLISDRRVPLISATGSCKMGYHVGQTVAQRMGRSLLELGGNNGLIVMDDADLELALQAVVFGAIGTTGQRCTTTRRLLLQKNIEEQFMERLLSVYEKIRPRIGNPLDENTLMGPLINEQATKNMERALEVMAEEQKAGHCSYWYWGGKIIEGPGFFVEPALVRTCKNLSLLKEEVFAPILYVLEFDTLEEAIEIHNDVPQGLSSSIFTESHRNVQKFLSAAGSDCGIANVNIGTSGAEVGGSFGGEKATGGGREAGGDSWQRYMRLQTVTMNFSSELPLAQGINFSY